MIKKQGFVALLDILGFSDRVARDAEVGGVDRYIKTVVDETSSFPDLGVILFSDTVVLFTLDDSDGAFAEVAEATSRLTYSLLAEEVPLRGAITHGVFAQSERDVHGTVLAGRPIIEAHSFESQLQWVGVMLAPSVLRKVPDLATRGVVYGPRDTEEPESYLSRIRHDARVQPCKGIPVQTSHEAPVRYLEGFAVVPISGDANSPKELLDCMSENLAKLRWLKKLAPDPRSQEKYQNTIGWLQPLYHQWTERLK